jgi:hypothetical protein
MFANVALLFFACCLFCKNKCATWWRGVRTSVDVYYHARCLLVVSYNGLQLPEGRDFENEITLNN